jgi:hypothetical protein
MTPLISTRTQTYFNDACLLSLRGDYSKTDNKVTLDGIKFDDKYQGIVFCFDDIIFRDLFLKDFTQSYSNFMKAHEDNFDIQVFDQTDKKQFQCFISDFEYKDDAENDFSGWVGVNADGLYFNENNVRSFN